MIMRVNFRKLHKSHTKIGEWQQKHKKIDFFFSYQPKIPLGISRMLDRPIRPCSWVCMMKYMNFPLLLFHLPWNNIRYPATENNVVKSNVYVCVSCFCTCTYYIRTFHLHKMLCLCIFKSISIYNGNNSRMFCVTRS